MAIEQLRKHHRSQPFKPFTIRTADGLEFEVRHPEVLAISPAGRTIVVMTPDGSHETIDLLLVTSIPSGNGRRTRGGRR